MSVFGFVWLVASLLTWLGVAVFASNQEFVEEVEAVLVGALCGLVWPLAWAGFAMWLLMRRVNRFLRDARLESARRDYARRVSS